MIKLAIIKARKLMNMRRALTEDEIQELKGLGFQFSANKKLMYKGKQRINVLTGFVFVAETVS